MTSLFRNKYRIESTRFKEYDYSFDGVYFITICTKNQEHYFGEIVNGELLGNEKSKICLSCWLDLPSHYNNCILDEFVIMPNHVHMIIFIDNSRMTDVPYVETGLKPVSTTGNNAERVYIKTKPVSTVGEKLKQYSISEIIRGFKTFTSRKINIYDHTPGRQLWQTRFYDHIIWNERELNNIREYILNNPYNWENDRNNL